MDSLSDPQHYMPDAARLEKIHEAIADYNAERPSIRMQAYIQVAVFMGIYAVLAIVVLALTLKVGPSGKHNPIGFVLAIAAAGGWWIWSLAWAPVRDLQLSLRYRLFPVVFGFIDQVQYSHGHPPSFLSEIRRMRLIAFAGSNNDDLISGRHDGLDFEMVESELTSGGKNKTVLFKGLLFRFTLDNEFPGLLLAAKRGNRFQEWLHDLFGHHNDTIASRDPDIDEAFEFHTDNYIAAGPIVEGPMVSALKYLRNQWWSGEPRIALRNRECFLLLPSSRDYFALPSIDRDVEYAPDVAPMIRDMVVLLAVAHLVKKIGPPVEIAPETVSQP